MIKIHDKIKNHYKCLFAVVFVLLRIFSILFGGGGESRTRVQTNHPNAFYMFSF